MNINLPFDKTTKSSKHISRSVFEKVKCEHKRAKGEYRSWVGKKLQLIFAFVSHSKLFVLKILALKHFMTAFTEDCKVSYRGKCHTIRLRSPSALFFVFLVDSIKV